MFALHRSFWKRDCANIPAQTLMPPAAPIGVTTWVWTCGNARGNNIWTLGSGVSKLKPHIAGT